MNKHRFISNGIEYYYTSTAGLISIYQQANSELIATAKIEPGHEQVFINYYDNNGVMPEFNVTMSWGQYMREFEHNGQIQTWLAATHPIN